MLRSTPIWLNLTLQETHHSCSLCSPNAVGILDVGWKTILCQLQIQQKYNNSRFWNAMLNKVHLMSWPRGFFVGKTPWTERTLEYEEIACIRGNWYSQTNSSYYDDYLPLHHLLVYYRWKYDFEFPCGL